MKQTKATRNVFTKDGCHVETLEGRYSPSSLFSLPVSSFFADLLVETGEVRGDGEVRASADRSFELRIDKDSPGLRPVSIADSQIEHSRGSHSFAPRVVDEVLSNHDESLEADDVFAHKLQVMGNTLRRGPNVSTYEVTITNLTNGQPFSPPLLASHRVATDIFTVGEAASVGIQQVAENGNNGPLREALEDDRHVYEIVEASAPIVPAADPGGTGFEHSVTLTITSAKGAKFLSLSTMLICTNDGFTGVDSIRLPKRVGNTATVLTAGYDAGTELNTEDFADIVPPCQGLIGISSDDMGTGMSNPALAEGGVISHHAGIMGGSDLVPGTHGWTDPVAEIVITRVS